MTGCLTRWRKRWRWKWHECSNPDPYHGGAHVCECGDWIDQLGDHR